MQKSLTNFFSSVFDLLLPPRKSESVVRKLSIHDLFSVAMPDGALPYRDPRVTALVWELKYRGNVAAAALAGEYLSELLMAEAGEALGKPLLVPMPMHAARRRERGYNQTELLCDFALRSLGETGSLSFDYAPGVLERVRDTAPQQGLARHKRLTNVKNSMQATNPARVRSRVCIVVDDVSTTGASFTEARRALLRAGAQEVLCVALARS
jgi:ComF family protein